MDEEKLDNPETSVDEDFADSFQPAEPAPAPAPVEEAPVEEAKPEEKEEPMAALRELYNSVPQVKCEALQKMTLMDDQLLRYSGWKEKSYAYGKNRRKRTLMKGWKQS